MQETLTGMMYLPQKNGQKNLQGSRQTETISSSDYDLDAQQLLKSPTTMSSARARETGKRMMETYMQAFEKGIIDATTYNTKSKAVLSSMSKNIQSGSYGNLLNRMGGWKGFFFNSDNEQNRNELSEYRENIAQRLQQEKEDAAIGLGDNNLKDVLTSLLSSIDAVMQGNGGTSDKECLQVWQGGRHVGCRGQKRQARHDQ